MLYIHAASIIIRVQNFNGSFKLKAISKITEMKLMAAVNEISYFDDVIFFLRINNLKNLKKLSSTFIILGTK
jgi:hypothetical protein